MLSIVIEVSFFKFLPTSSSALVQVPGKQSLLVYFRFYNVFQSECPGELFILGTRIVDPCAS